MGLKEFKEKITKDEAYAKKFAGVTEIDKIVAMAKEDGLSVFTGEPMTGESELGKEGSPHSLSYGLLGRKVLWKKMQSMPCWRT